MKIELKALYKLISKRINHDYKVHRTQTIKKHLQATGSAKKAYKELKPHKSWIGELKNSTKTTQNRSEILKIATEFYKDLYSPPNQSTYELPSRNTEKAIVAFTEEEVAKGIKALKSDKSPGPDRITNEVIKAGSTCLVTPLTRLFNMILTSTNSPRQWSESEICSTKKEILII
ncbi:uncharacterized protein LOC124530505 [Vanessa cardui]|uniref:uncharacterized protein LOC124530505 n=1 Tax=Vanessa cardui TaxID=171605 RepID=UPI001F12EC15|nr:uncharacterized protein LOC124530505 [Vanessa cardui]